MKLAFFLVLALESGQLWFAVISETWQKYLKRIERGSFGLYLSQVAPHWKTGKVLAKNTKSDLHTKLRSFKALTLKGLLYVSVFWTGAMIHVRKYQGIFILSCQTVKGGIKKLFPPLPAGWRPQFFLIRKFWNGQDPPPPPFGEKFRNILSFFMIKSLWIGWDPPFWQKYPKIPSLLWKHPFRIC